MGLTSHWAEYEKEIIRSHYGRGEGITLVYERLPGRSRAAIFAMAIKMGITSPRNWHDDEVTILSSHYPKLGVKVASLLPGRTEDAVKLKASSLKLKYVGGKENGSHQRIWNHQELLLLKKYHHLPLTEAMVFFPDRSPSSIRKARVRLRKPRQSTEG